MEGEKVAIYCRVDWGGEKESRRASLDFQYKHLQRYARKLGLEIISYYEDDGFSGHDMTRPGLQQMLADYQEKKFSAVLVLSIDRLFRGKTLEQPKWPFPVYTSDFIPRHRAKLRG